VVPAVAGSNPVGHPKRQFKRSIHFIIICRKINLRCVSLNSEFGIVLVVVLVLGALGIPGPQRDRWN
jgi:hypothetical protein